MNQIDRLVIQLGDAEKNHQTVFAEDRQNKELFASAKEAIENLAHIANTFAVHLPDCEWYDSSDTPCSCGYEKAMGELAV